MIKLNTFRIEQQHEMMLQFYLNMMISSLMSLIWKIPQIVTELYFLLNKQILQVLDALHFSDLYFGLCTIFSVVAFSSFVSVAITEKVNTETFYLLSNEHLSNLKRNDFPTQKYLMHLCNFTDVNTLPFYN